MHATIEAAESIVELKDPRESRFRPPFAEQHQAPVGTELQMHPIPDHGEDTYRGSGKLTGRAALITGADSGIGRAVALAFAREGADVLVSYLDEHEDAAASVGLVTEAGRKAVAVPGDVGDEHHCHELVRRALQEFGRLDILVNNAAFQTVRRRLEDFPSEEFERTFRTNLFSVFHLCKAAVPHLKPGAAVINTTSIEAFRPKSVLMPYAASKAAILNLTKSLSQDLIQRGVRVNAVAPGPVWTPLIPSSFPPDQVAEFGRDNPMGRPAQPAELAAVYVLLAGDDAGYITGQVYGVTGGEFLF